MHFEKLATAKRRLAIAGLLGIPTCGVLSPAIFGSPGTNPALFEYLLGYGYSVGLWFGLLTLWWLCRRPESPLLAPPTKHTGPEYWGIAIGLAAIAATLAVSASADALNHQHAYWARLTVKTTAVQPPQLAVRYGSAPRDFAGVQWQPYRETILTLRLATPSGEGHAVRIEQLLSDGKPVDLAKLYVHRGVAERGGVTLVAPTDGMLRWPCAARAVSFLVSGGPGRAEFYWLDQVREVAVGPQPQTVTFGIEGAYQGWALLPPRQIDSLSLDPPAVLPGTYDIEGEVLADSTGKISLSPVRLNPSGRTPAIWHLANSINRRRPGALAGGWLVVFAAEMLALFCLFRCSKFLESRPAFVRLRSVCCPQMPGPGAQLPAFLRAALPVWMVCLAYHLLFALSVQTAFSNDSIGYYSMARNLLTAPYLQDIQITRTPGYPLFLASVLRGFGDTVLGVAIFQHVALASLSVITMWCLWDRLPRPWLVAAGLLAGISPAIAPTANILWTEALFTTFGCAALLLASCRRRLAYMLLAGISAGLATMLRPNGLLLVAAVGGCLVLEFFWRRDGSAWRIYAQAILALVSGYAMVAAPWHMHLAWQRHTLALGKGLKEFGSWAGYIFEGQLPPGLRINGPNRAVFADPLFYGNDAYVLMDTLPLIVGDEETYYRETQAEWFQTQSPGPYLSGLRYNATLQWDRRDLFYAFEEIRGTLSHGQAVVTSAPAGGGDVRDTLLRLTSAAPKAPAMTGTACTALSVFVLNHWKWLLTGALLGAAAACFMPWMIPLFVYALATVVTYSTNLIPGERYIVVLEPLYYILAAGAMGVIWRLGARGYRGVYR